MAASSKVLKLVGDKYYSGPDGKRRGELNICECGDTGFHRNRIQHGKSNTHRRKVGLVELCYRCSECNFYSASVKASHEHRNVCDGEEIIAKLGKKPKENKGIDFILVSSSSKKKKKKDFSKLKEAMDAKEEAEEEEAAARKKEKKTKKAAEEAKREAEEAAAKRMAAERVVEKRAGKVAKR